MLSGLFNVGPGVLRQMDGQTLHDPGWRRGGVLFSLFVKEGMNKLMTDHAAEQCEIVECAFSGEMDRTRLLIEQGIGQMGGSRRTEKFLSCMEDNLHWSGGYLSELRRDLLIGVFEYGTDAHPRFLIVRAVELNDEMSGVSMG